MEKVEFENYQNCLRLSNGEVETIVSTEFGPRILAYNFAGGENVLGLYADAKTETELGIWRPYGGHRLWLAPENMPKSYAPDNAPVKFFFDETKNSIHLLQPADEFTKTLREISITLDGKGSGVEINHKITNLGEIEIEISAWALTIMRGGGEVLIPNEAFAPYGEKTLLPVRNLAVWAYTDLSDARWKFDKDYIRLRVDAAKKDAQKIGVANKKGYVKYNLEDVVFTKHFEHFENVIYPDLNSSTEIYTAGDFIEIETLSPLKKIAPRQFVEHVEKWSLEKRTEN